MNQPDPPQPNPPRPDPPQPVDDQWGRMPPPPVPLILSEQPMGTGVRMPVRPGRVLLFSEDGGRIVRLPKHPGRLAARRYRWCYEVDVSDHFTALHLLVPSKSKAAKFRLAIDAGWRVTDPARIVTSRIADGNAIVRSRVLEALLPICRSYTIVEDDLLERDLVETLGRGRVHDYPEGIALFRFAAQVDHDTGAAERIEEQVRATHQRQLTKEGIESLRGEITSEVDLILLSMQQNPEQVHQIIADIRTNKQMNVKARTELFTKMMEADLIQEAEVDSLRQLLIQPIEDIVRPRPAGIFGVEQVPAPQAIGSGRDVHGRDRDEDDEEEDVMPGQVIEGSIDGVSGWRPPPWQQTPGQDASGREGR